MESVLRKLGIEAINAGAACGQEALAGEGVEIASVDPTTGREIARVRLATGEQLDEVVVRAQAAWRRWRMVPAPQRGEIVREIGQALREHKEALGRLITLEVGKVTSEGAGEVQEAVDMADFACGLSRQLYGLTTHSERPAHRLYEQWHPLGVVGVITAFNFPCAVWAWNAMLALVCGDAVIWKPSLKAPLVALATHRICAEVLARRGFGDVLGLVIGQDAAVGEALVADRRLPLISATGSCRMGRRVNQVVAGRLGRCLLELGGNNAVIVHRDADQALALRAVAFGAVGTSGQRCTSTRRLFVHEDIHDDFVRRLSAAYESLPIGDPASPGTLVGPLIDGEAVAGYEAAIAAARAQGGRVLVGGSRIEGPGFFVEPTLIEIRHDAPIVHEETFAPILYVSAYRELDEAIAWQNEVEQGLSSAIFTDSFRAAERFLAHDGSDCGIANVNAGTSGAEIGGAFGGEKDTGGGREAGSDAWKHYMRRQTCTLNRGAELPLAQGVTFDLD